MGNGITGSVVASTVFTPQSAVPVAHTQSIQNLLAGNKWGGAIGTGTDLTYSFTNYSSIFNYSTTGMYELKLMTTEQQTAAVNAMMVWSNVANVTFSAVSETDVLAGDIRFSATTASDLLTTNEISAPNTASNGDIWIGPNNGGYNSAVAGSYSFDAFMHELGHALGLDHPHTSVIAPVSGEDQLKYSIMSYRAFNGDSATGDYGNTFFPTSPMLNDIAAIQYLYGANMSYKTGNDTYIWSDNQKIFETIWDAGGNDTIDASNQSAGVVINLNSGQWSQIGGTFWNGQSYVRDCLTIAYGAVIENAKGTSLNDTLIGNEVNNTLNGGAGIDTVVFSSNKSNYTIIKNIDGSITVTDIVGNHDGSDILLNIEQIQFLDSTIQTVDIVVGPTNHAPTSASATITTNEDTATVLTLNNFVFSDVDIGNTLSKVMITLLPTAGLLKLNGVAVTLNQVITSSDINTGKLIFTPATNANGIAYSSFGFKVSDGTTYSATANTITIDVVPINDIPIGVVSINGIIAEGQTLTASNTLIDKDGMGAITYQWLSDGIAITDAIQSSYILTTNEIGQKITVRASYTDEQGTPENILSSATITVIKTNFIGTSGVDLLQGNSGNNIINGGMGADTMIGGLGNDTYYVDNAQDVVKEAVNGGNDTINASISYTLSSNVENLTLSGTDAINATGNTLANTLIGNSGNNLLNGKAGADAMMGGLGNDTYIVDNVKDVVTENIDEGIDTVNSSITYMLGSNIENLTLTGTVAMNATGNTFDNILTGNNGANLLDGKTGADTMIGGLGNDTYIVDNLGESIIETSILATEIDTVKSSISFTLGTNLEKLILTSTDNINATGNALANTLTGNAGMNILDGGIGADKMIGGAGNDTYIIDNVKDVVTEAVNAGNDTINSSLTYILGTNVENLTLTGVSIINGTGNTVANTLIGNNGANILNGKGGNDILTGGAGNDIFVFNTALNSITNKDSITDFASGQDTIRLENAIFTKLLAPGALSANNFITITGTGGATDKNDYIIYNSDTGVLSYDADGSGTGHAIQFATLIGQPAITIADFLVS